MADTITIPWYTPNRVPASRCGESGNEAAAAIAPSISPSTGTITPVWVLLSDFQPPGGVPLGEQGGTRVRLIRFSPSGEKRVWRDDGL
jgi:hypothetical protein